jgi:hypothetical protein
VVGSHATKPTRDAWLRLSLFLNAARFLPRPARYVSYMLEHWNNRPPVSAARLNRALNASSAASAASSPSAASGSSRGEAAAAAGAGKGSGGGNTGGLDLLLTDPRGRMPIHYCAAEADDPAMIGALLLSGAATMDAAAVRAAQLRAWDGDGKTAEALLSDRQQQQQLERGRHRGQNSRQRQQQQGRGARGASSSGGARNWLGETIQVLRAAADGLARDGRDGQDHRAAASASGARAAPGPAAGRSEL